MRKLLKKLLLLTLVFAMVLGTSTGAFAKPHSTKGDLKTAYKEIMSYATDNNIPLNMTFEDFVKGYEEQVYSDVQAYSDVYYSLLQPQLGDSSYSLSGDDAWYYNIGTSLPSTATPVYSKYNLLNTVQKGDIVFEANGGFGITAHIAIVEGFYYNAAQNVTYIRIIEAIDDGVVRSVLDDTRVDDKDVSIYRVTSATTYDKQEAVDFCIGEIGSSYWLDFAKDTSSSETDWYCSELVWAGYYNQGIDIETDAFFNEPGVTPRDIRDSSEVNYISFK